LRTPLSQGELDVLVNSGLYLHLVLRELPFRSFVYHARLVRQINILLADLSEISIEGSKINSFVLADTFLSLSKSFNILAYSIRTIKFKEAVPYVSSLRDFSCQLNDIYSHVLEMGLSHEV
jgi:dimeric dUTPase (all-alpha-NTP-PPase superfamily)